MALKNTAPVSEGFKAKFNWVTQAGASTLRNLPFGGALGVVAAGIVLWLAPHVIPDGWSLDKVKAFLDGLRLFGLGYSWGGFESLAIIGRPRRTAAPWPAEDHIIRLQIGLEDSADLIADLEASFARVSNLS